MFLPPAVDLTSVLTPEIMAPILANPEVQQRLMPYLPSGESLPQSSEELNNTLSSPQFQQVCSLPDPPTPPVCGPCGFPCFSDPDSDAACEMSGQAVCGYSSSCCFVLHYLVGYFPPLCRLWACSAALWRPGSWGLWWTSLVCLQRLSTRRTKEVCVLPASSTNTAIVYFTARTFNPTLMFSLEAVVHCSANFISGGIHQSLLTKNWT